MEASKCFAIGSRSLSWVGFFMICFAVASMGRDSQSSSPGGAGQQAAAEKEFTVRIAVEEVRLDVVVLDGKGRQIPNLTAADFEVFQDDVPQDILSCTYITDQTAKPARPSVPSKASKEAPQIPARMPSREEVRRVITFVVDDFSMSFENINHARMALSRFVERQMQPGDLVAILRTSRGMSAFQMFLSDRTELRARIDTVRWGENVGRDLSADNLYYLFDAQLSTVRYCIRALRDMPGRKALLLLTAQPTIPAGLPNREPMIPQGSPIPRDPFDYLSMYQRSYNRLADEALRAGVVIHTLDIRGLRAPLPGPTLGGSPTMAQIAYEAADAMNPLPQKTGGLFLKDSNFFLNGIDEVNDALKGYYILSYAPPGTTFKPSRKNIYHRIRIKVRRRGASVHTRDGFYGVAESSDGSGAAKIPLREALLSPFKYGDLKVRLASGYVDDPKAGYLIRSWLHLDAQDVTITEKEGEGHFTSLETVCVTSDVNGYIQDANIVRYEFRIPDENLEWVRESGIRFTILLPVKKPGSYYVRAAVKDMASEKVGSAYQFVEIPDLKKKQLAISNMFLVGRNENASWIWSGISEDLSQTWVKPVLQREDQRSPAHRSFLPGEGFEYAAAVYNAKHEGEDAPDLESEFVLFKDGLEFFRSEPQKFALTGIRQFDRIPVRRRLLLGKGLQKGDYVLQLVVRDNKRGGKHGTAFQSLTFEIPEGVKLAE